ncbi:MAG: hypothetical protein ACM3O5_07650 [Betaproteobacteria bacterium]
MNDACGGNSPLSLQDKLDRISHDRDVLAQLRDLARRGLHDGDPVCHRESGARGRVVLLRAERVPCSVVQLDDGRQVPLDCGWSPTRGS